MVTPKDKEYILYLKNKVHSCPICSGSGGVLYKDVYQNCECFKKYQFDMQAILAGVGLHWILGPDCSSLPLEVQEIVDNLGGYMKTGFNLFICGPNDTHTTDIATTILKMVLHKRYIEEDIVFRSTTVSMMSLSELLEIIDTFSQEFDIEARDKRVVAPTVLTITDLVVNWSSEAQRTDARVSNIFKTRFSRGLSTVFTSSLQIRDIGNTALISLLQKHYIEIIV